MFHLVKVIKPVAAAAVHWIMGACFPIDRWYVVVFVYFVHVFLLGVVLNIAYAYMNIYLPI